MRSLLVTWLFGPRWQQGHSAAGLDSWRVEVWGFTAKPLHIPLKGLWLRLSSPQLSLPPADLPTALPTRIPVRLWRGGWDCVSLMEAENKITHFYSSLFHGDKDGPCAAAVDGISFRRCRCQPCVEADVGRRFNFNPRNICNCHCCCYIYTKNHGTVRICQFGCLVWRWIKDQIDPQWPRKVLINASEHQRQGSFHAATLL